MNVTAMVPAGVPSTEAPGRAFLRGRPFPWLILLLVGINGAATVGQTKFFLPRVTNANGWEDWALAGYIALCIEMIGVYLASMAHAALMADQSAGLLRFGSYIVGGGVGFLNYWHFCGPNWTPTALALVFGGFSAISPLLWAIYSRHKHRARLTELGLVDKRGVKLSINRKIWAPWKSLKVMKFAAWEGITNPDEAVRAWELREAAKQLDGDPSPVSPATGTLPFRKRTERWEEISHLRDIHPGITQAEVAKMLGCTERTVRNCAAAAGVKW